MTKLEEQLVKEATKKYLLKKLLLRATKELVEVEEIKKEAYQELKQDRGDEGE